jgi:hypothetical protein
MLEACPSHLREMIVQLLMADRFVEAKKIFDKWNTSQMEKQTDG